MMPDLGGQFLRCVGLWSVRAVPAATLLLLGVLLLLRTTPTPHPRGALAEWMTDEDDEVLPAGIARVRERFVPGYTRAHAELCKASGAHTRLVILVASEPAHAQQRMAVRHTWGYVANRVDITLGFVLGESPSSLQATLDAEDALYGDLIQGRYHDSYGNLTLKTLSMLEWFSSYCPRAGWLLKTDDDVFINVEGVLKFVQAPERQNAKRTIWGHMFRKAHPFRNNTKYFVPPEEFPGDRYPPYVSGVAYAVSGDVVGELLRASLRARWLRMEDALVTGVAAAAAGVRHEPAPMLDLIRHHVDACVLRTTLAIHQVSLTKQFELWRDLHDPRIECP